MKEIPFVSGAVLVVDKPLNWTSFDVVKKIRYTICKQFNLKKIKGWEGVFFIYIYIPYMVL